ncbi:hypothetical protein JAAARDRAFT_190676 [Jaapia argillacea MUCL 33604]|uniref:Uncharacterized protein n=1 Tax=Jaapia argillacea MUCL 33604 TaxID=933084 RepID=A0A067Q4T0_9AGAM|nr:hypothetical protein JAAARDRAFT_190676 [Jaapia argillacea MUCL 33604]
MCQHAISRSSPRSTFSKGRRREARELLDARVAQQDPNYPAQCVNDSDLPNDEDEAQVTRVDAVSNECPTHDEVGDVMLQIMSSADASSDLTMVDAWYNLSLPIGLPDPRDFFKEEKAIRKAEILARRAACEAEEDATWAQERKQEERQIAAPKLQSETLSPINHPMPELVIDALGPQTILEASSGAVPQQGSSKKLRHISKQILTKLGRRSTGELTEVSREEVNLGRKTRA